MPRQNQMETDEERKDRLRRARIKRNERLARETPEARARRFERQRNLVRTNRARESEEVRYRRLEKNRIAQANRIKNESKEKRELRRLQSKKRYHKIANGRRQATLGIAFKNLPPHRHYCGKMDKACDACKALHFQEELSMTATYGYSKVQVYNSCCNKGNIELQLFKDYPIELQQLFTYQSEHSGYFLNNIRSYNNSLAMASMTTQINTSMGKVAKCFKIHDVVYHPTGSSRSPGGPILIFDNEQATEELVGGVTNREYENSIFELLHDLLLKINPYIVSFKLMDELYKDEEARAEENNVLPPNIRMILKDPSNLDSRYYNAPTANEVSIVYVGDDDIPAERNYVIQKRNGNSRYITDTNELCDPLMYPLFFPKGEPGWNPELKKEDISRARQRITQREYYAYIIFPRQNFFNPILHSSKLFQQYIVDSWLKIEQNRLNYVRAHQSELQFNTIRGVMDFMNSDRQEAANGRKFVLPANCVGGVRSMISSYHDIMSLVSKYGNPDYFLTFSCNPNWPEIKESLAPNQQALDRPDIVARVFQLKVAALEDEIFKKNVLGEVASYFWVIEFQKSGFPHCHMLITMETAWKPGTTSQIDCVISAELPDPKLDPELFNIISTTMIHPPCGSQNPNAPCMKNGHCSQKFPKNFQAETIFDVHRCPVYKRRNDGRIVAISGVDLDNRSIVPYSPYFSKLFEAHISLEVCDSISAAKYLLKYVYKGTDRAFISINDDNQHNEMRNHLDTRYVCPSEACHRIFGFTLQAKSDAVVRLQVHLPDFQSITFKRDQENDAQVSQSTLIAWFCLNKSNDDIAAANGGVLPDNIFDSRKLFYFEMPKQYCFEHGEWKQRLRICRTIGRMYYVSPHDSERFALRLLLLNIRGASSFEHLRTIDGHTYSNFADAAKAAGLTIDDSNIIATLQDTLKIHFQVPRKLRELLVTLMMFCEIASPTEIWVRFKSKLSADFVHLHNVDALTAEAMAYNEISEMFAAMQKDVKNFLDVDHQNISLPMVEIESTISCEEHYKLAYEKYLLLNTSQKLIVDEILQAIDNQDTYCNNKRCFFIDGPAGSGKTLVFSTIYHFLQARKLAVQCVAWTGISANLLPNGQTVCSAFKLSAPNYDNSLLNQQSAHGRRIANTEIIIWDDVSMVPRKSFESIDELLRDLMQNKLPFGGKFIILGGDFRQLLPLIEKGSREQQIVECVKRSHLWKHFQQHCLSLNMRVREEDARWADYLLKIGEGRIKENLDNEIPILDEYLCHTDLIEHVFGECFLPNADSNLLADFVILTPKNVDVIRVNEVVLEKIQGTMTTVKSIDEAVADADSDAYNFPTEFLNHMTPAGMPPHQLNLKVGAIVMLLRDLNVNNGLYVGTRLIVQQIEPRILVCTFAAGPRKCSLVTIPRIDCIYESKELSFKIRRRQFPVKLSFAMTINESVGQSFDKIGLWLNEHVFSHGQLYVALSRARTMRGVALHRPFAKNIVSQEVLN